ncbi:DUF5684 domain-containing protein [Pedobacter sp. MW01-1-1]|uniref:DUF5684 domain-containing protein n=1 Tax=Pedobacter sp. MW01-1-1 TaxID=3383027 RepID=UPI003FF1391A
MDYQDSTAVSGVAAGIGTTFILGIVIFSLVLSVIVIAGHWKTFEKAGKPGWACLIPIYNIIVLLEIIGKPTIWLLWILIPCTSFIFMIWATNLLSKSFGKSEGFTIGLIFLPFIFYPILGFGEARYLGPSAAEAQNNPFANKPFGGNENPFGNQ